MTKKAILLFLVVYTLYSTSLFSQEIEETPEHFGQFYNNPLFNLSRGGLDSRYELNFDQQRNVGGFRGVSTSYFSFFYNPNYRKRSSPKVNSKNIYGVYFYNDHEGDYIARNRIQFIFTRHQRISKEWHFSLGVSGGLYLFGIKPSSTTKAYSANAFEGNSSLLFYNRSFQIGLAMNQFTNNKIQPIYQITRLKRHYYFFSQYKIEKEFYQFIPSIYLKYQNNNYPVLFEKKWQTGASVRLVYNIVMGGISYDNNGVYVTTGLNNWEINKKKINLDFSYFVPLARQSNVNVNRMEINIKLKL